MSSHKSSAIASPEPPLVSAFPEEDLSLGGHGNPGYFPAWLGQRLGGGRYGIVRKLGWGQYSSVWLARDFREQTFVALKILTCEATLAMTPGPDQRSDELCMLKKAASAQPAHRGYRHVLQYYESFEFEGPLGTHRCIVTEVLGFSLDHVRKMREDGDRRVPVDIVKRIVKQVLFGLEYLHDVCGIVHGDLKHDNIILRPRELETIVAQELISNPSITYVCPTEFSPPVVPVISQPLPLTPDPPIPVRLLEAVIADVGHAHWQDRHFQETIQPSALRAPEVILGHTWSTPADIWNLGCLVTELLIGSWLFKPSNTQRWSYEEDHLARMTEELEESFELSFLDHCSHRDEFFRHDGGFARYMMPEEPAWPLRRLLETFSELDREDVQLAEHFLKQCLRLNPNERATAKELVDDPWLADSL
ncbi:kinase-like domain-containing protein [Lenzites betulinus]|nr:kinase-like domain-containing protein [Lenzites betulinus]